MQLVFFSFQHAEKSLHAIVFFFSIAIDDRVALGRGKLAKGNFKRNSFGAGEAAHVQRKLTVTRLRPGMDRAVGEGFAFVGDNAIDIEINGVAETLTARTSAVRAVERKQARLRLLVHSATFLALEALVEHQTFRRFTGRVRHKFQNGFAAPFAVTNLD